MARAAIQVDGLDRLRAELRRAKDVELNAEMKQFHQELAAEIVELALPEVPVLSGDLAETVRAAGTVRDAIGRAGSKAVPYGPPIHWGWKARGIPARPFLQNAAAQIETGVVDRYDRAVARMLDRVITP